MYPLLKCVQPLMRQKRQQKLSVCAKLSYLSDVKNNSVALVYKHLFILISLTLATDFNAFFLLFQGVSW